MSLTQREADVPVWGWSEPNDEISVEFAEQRVSTKADADGKWMVTLKPIPGSATSSQRQKTGFISIIFEAWESKK